MTTTHEHLLIDFGVVFKEPQAASQRQLMDEEVSLENLGWVRYNWNSNRDNLRILDEEISTWEAQQYFNAGGSTIVDVTSVGLARDPQALMRISRATGLNVVMGAGHYVHMTHPPELDDLTVEQIAGQIIHDVDLGVGDSGIRSGIIGEIGCSWPWHESEKKVLEAAVIAQRETGAPLLIHPGRSERAPLELLEAVDKWGGRLDRTVMGHVERTVYDRGILNELIATGAYLNFDLFGHESSFYPLAPESYMPADHERIEMVEHMVAEGRRGNILLAHDICSKHRLKTYGGHGFDHILTHVIPRMRARGMSEEVIRLILVDNPTRMLTFD
jgi:phosphotriesterase-related protein|tara:strand:- start:3246 stop:4232 length:987 start_codon:yes stop_codon:yes gene_type:complete